MVMEIESVLSPNCGNIIWPDRQMMALAQDMLKQQPGANVVFDVKCSRHLGHEIQRYGGVPHMCKTGHALIKDAMLRLDVFWPVN